MKNKIKNSNTSDEGLGEAKRDSRRNILRDNHYECLRINNVNPTNKKCKMSQARFV